MLKRAYYTAGAAWAHLNTHHPIGRSIYTHDWDVCIILDSARTDLTRPLARQYLDDYHWETAWSRGSVTTEWLTNTFRPTQDVRNTVLVSATPHTQTVFRDRHWLTNNDTIDVDYPLAPAADSCDFAALYELWQTHTNHHDVVPPETMVEATLDAVNRHPDERIVSHWLQPHEPFIHPETPLHGGDAFEKNVWQGLAAGDLNDDEVWEAYRLNHALALEYVAEFVRRYDGRVLVTADHGNAFGEVGVYGHPFGFLQPAVRRVPWITIDTPQQAPGRPQDVLSAPEQHHTADDTVEGQLAALGYR